MSPRVLVVRSINLDETVRVNRLPCPGETVAARVVRRGLGGKGANQAVAAARAGAEVTLVGAVGSDGGDALAELEREGIDIRYVASDPEEATGRAIVLVDHDAENSIVLLTGANSAIPDGNVRAACRELAPGDVLVLQQEIPTETSRLAAELARAAGATVIWNAAPAPDDSSQLLRTVDQLILNEHELLRLAELLDAGGSGGAPLDDTILDVAAMAGCDVICTLGAKGVLYASAGITGRIPAIPVQAVDTTAAGDTFVGYVAGSSGVPLIEQLELAVVASALTVTRPGAATSVPHRAELATLLTNDRSIT
ncbi:MAG: ribokinase [Propionibacteriaceae bacterium]